MSESSDKKRRQAFRDEFRKADFQKELRDNVQKDFFLKYSWYLNNRPWWARFYLACKLVAGKF